MINGFELSAGQTIDIITANAVTGTFDNVIAPDGMNIQVTYSDSTVSLAFGLLGDVNRDGAIDFKDISPFIGLLSTGNIQFEADVNQDGVVNFVDISVFINLLAGQ